MKSTFTKWVSLFSVFLFIIALGLEQCQSRAGSTYYIFSYFKGNGEDGLHLAFSTDGFTWSALKGDASFLTPRVGQDRLMRDPCVIQGPDGSFHMVWTVSWNERGIGYAHSSDLIHWSSQQYIPVMEQEPNAQNCWAPELFYDAETGKYLIVWATTIPGRFPETDNQSNQGPPAPGRNHRIYYTTTKDFQQFEPTALFYNQGFNVIDATIQKAGDRYVMFLKDETNKPFVPQKNIRMAFSEHAEGPYGPPSAPITGDYWAEGPTAIRIDGVWRVYFDKYRQGTYGVVTSPDLEHWTDRSADLQVPEGMRHGTVLQISKQTAAQLLKATSDEALLTSN